MKKFMKSCGIIALVLIVAGVVIGVISAGIQGRTSISSLVDSVTNGKVQLNLGNENGFGLILNADKIAEQFSEQFSDENVLFEVHSDYNSKFDDNYEIYKGDVEKTALGSDVSKLDIEMGGCLLEMKESEDDQFYMEATNVSKFQGYVKKGKLHLHSIRKTTEWGEIKKSTVTLYVPRGVHFDKVNIELGAGQIDCGSIQADKVELEVGAGQILISEIEAIECEVSVGMGEIVANQINVSDLKAEVGMGSFSAHGDIANADIECAMGSVTLELIGNEEDYNYEIDAAMGNVTVGSMSFGGVAKEKHIDNHATKKIELECSMGSIDVIFAK